MWIYNKHIPPTTKASGDDFNKVGKSNQGGGLTSKG